MKKLVLVAIAVTVVFCTAAGAADLPTKAVVYKADPNFNWNGFYAGANLGYGWGTRNEITTNPAGAIVGAGSVNPRGWLGGGQAGYNWVLAPSWLLGIEGDFSFADFKDVENSPVATGNSRANWFATMRGRLGYTANNWLVYGTGGAAWTHNTDNRTINAGLPSAGETSSPSSVFSGWTAGGGVEYGFASSWTAKLEYLYMRFPNANVDFAYSVPAAARHGATTLDANVVRLGVNYLFNAGAVLR